MPATSLHRKGKQTMTTPKNVSWTNPWLVVPSALVVAMLVSAGWRYTMSPVILAPPEAQIERQQ